MRVELKHFPLLAGTLDSVIVVEDGTLAHRPRTRARSQSVPIAPGYELKVCKGRVLCKETELDLITSDTKEGGGGPEDLSKDGV